MDLSLWLAFVAASIALLMIPGPTVLLVLSYALSQGRRVALASAAGVAMGDLLAMSASLAGLGTLVLTSATLFTLLKWVGAAYLVYLGVKLFLSAPSTGLQTSVIEGALPAGQIFAHAAAVTALNPKSIAFFIAFVPQFISDSRPLLPQFIILTATFVGLAAANTLVYAVLADKMRTRLARPAAITIMTRVGGGALVAMGIATATLRRA